MITAYKYFKVVVVVKVGNVLFINQDYSDYSRSTKKFITQIRIQNPGVFFAYASDCVIGYMLDGLPIKWKTKGNRAYGVIP